MKRRLHSLIAAVVLSGASVLGQTVRDIPFDSTDPLRFPNDIHLGEVAGVATNSKGDIFVYTRTGHPVITIGTARPFSRGGSRMFQLDTTGKFVREIGQDNYGFLVAQQLRVDPQDNVWAIDQMSNTLIKFDPAGQVQMLLGRKAEAERVPALPLAGGAAPAAAGRAGAAAPSGRGGAGGGEEGGRRGGGPPGGGAPQDLFIRPTDVAWDAAGNIYVADGLGANARVAKFNKEGRFVRSWGQMGSGQGQFNQVTGVAIDAQGDVYVADRGNRRIQVFDGDGNFKRQIGNIGAPAALCMTRGAHQYLYSSNSNPPDDIDVAGEIYKLELDGRIVGKFGRAGKLPKEFGTVNSIDCRDENTLYVGEIGNWRVQKLTLRP